MEINNNELSQKKIVDCKELALKKVVFSGDVVGKFGTFEIEQTFVNNTKDILEVNYTFPIIDTATVTGFIVTVGDKVLHGVCKEKEEALKEYTESLVKGNSAYMMNQKTDNIFDISVGKVDINEEVKIKISYIDFLQVVDNEIKLLIPTLVYPRYKSEITSKLEYGDVEYTADFKINIDKSMNIDTITSGTHEIEVKELKTKFKVSALKYDMSSDFALDIKLKKELNSNAVISKTKDDKQIISLSFMPEIEDKYEDSEKEYIFIVDISGSMGGRKLEETKNAVKECLRQLDEGDRFNIIPFESRFSVFEIEAVEYNETNLKRAEKYIDNLSAKGGTEILEPIKFALYERNNDKVVLLFTDGEVGNENEIINFVSDNIKESKLFAFGIDTSINTAFIRNLSKAGNGKAEFIHPGEKIDDKVIRTFARIQTPLVRDLTIDYGKNKMIDEIKEDNTLFNYEFFNAIVKIEDLVDDISLKCKISGEDFEWKILKEAIIDAEVNLEKVLAKLQINRLEDYIKMTTRDKREAYEKMIIDISVNENIATKYTTFITVYERENKLVEVPKVQNITLSDAALEACCVAKMSKTLDVPTFLRTKSKRSPVASYGRMMDMDDRKDINRSLGRVNNIDKEKVKTYFTQNEIKSLKTYLLFAIYFSQNNIKCIEENDLNKFLNENVEVLKTDDELAYLVFVLYHYARMTTKKYIELYALAPKYKKVLNTKLLYMKEFDFENIKNEDLDEYIEKDIDTVLLIAVSDFDKASRG